MKTSVRMLLLSLMVLFLFQFTVNAQSFTWVKGITTGDGIAVGYGITYDNYSGDIVVTGNFSGTVSFDTIQLTCDGGVNGRDIFIAKYGYSGNIIWAKKAGGTLMDGGTGISIDQQGNIYVTGFFSDIANFDTLHLTSFGGGDIFIAMMDPNGNFIWAKHAGGVNSDIPLGIAADRKGNCYITGTFFGSASFGNITLTGSNSENPDIFIARYDHNGICTLAKKAGGNDADISNSICVDQNMNSYITGNFRGTATFDTIQLSTYGSNGLDDIFIAKYDSNGNCLWAKQAGGIFHDYGKGISVDNYGSTNITGSFQGAVQFDSFQLTSYGGDDIFIAKYDSSGNCLWVRQAGGVTEDVGSSVSTAYNGDCYVTGTFTGSAKFESRTMTSYGGNDIFITNYNRFGGLDGMNQAGGAGDDEGISIFTHYSGVSYFSTGLYNGPAKFDQFQLSGKGAFVSEIIFIKDAVGTESISPNEYFLSQNYPNPFNPNTVISYSLPSATNIKLIVYNTLGQTVKVLENGFKNAGNYSVNFNASDLPSGIYFYELKAGQFSQVKKMILIK